MLQCLSTAVRSSIFAGRRASAAQLRVALPPREIQFLLKLFVGNVPLNPRMNRAREDAVGALRTAALLHSARGDGAIVSRGTSAF